MEIYLDEKLTTHFYEQKQQLVIDLELRAKGSSDLFRKWEKQVWTDNSLPKYLNHFLKNGTIEIVCLDQETFDEIAWKLQYICELLIDLKQLKELALKGKAVEILFRSGN